MKARMSFPNVTSLLVAVTLSLPAAAGPDTAASGAKAECKSAPRYAKLFASLAEGENRKASPPAVVLPALSERERAALKGEFLVENGYVGPASEAGAETFEMCAPYGLLSSFKWVRSPQAEDGEDEAAAVEVARQFLVDNVGLTGVAEKDDLTVENVWASDGIGVTFGPQTHEGLTVSNTGILVRVRGHRVEGVYGHWYPEQVLDIPEVQVTESEAKSVMVGVKLKFRGTAGDWHYAEITEEGLGAAELVITPIERPGEGLGLVREWKISASAGGLKSWMVYVDAVSGGITRTEQLFET